MKKILIVGHGYFATGLISSLELIIGKQLCVMGIDFTSEMSSNHLTKQIEEYVSTVSVEDELYCFTDLAGGTPFNVCCVLSQYRHSMYVLTGTNLAMVIEATMKSIYNMPFDMELIRSVGIQNIETTLDKKNRNEPPENGI